MPVSGKLLAALVGIGVPSALLALDILVFSSNPLGFIATVTWILGGGIYLVSYQEHE